MSVSRSVLIARGARRIGGRTGTLGTVTVGATTTTAILNGLVNVNAGDNTFFAGDRLFIVATNGTMQETSITSWADTTGTATFLNLASSPAAGNTYILVNREDYSLVEFKDAINKALRYSRRTYRQVIPIVPYLTQYPLSTMDWLEGAGDVDAMWVNQSPITLHNEDFSLWQNGAALAPDGWTLSAGTVAKTAGGLRSAYYANLTSATLTQSMPAPLVQWITRRIAPVYTPIRGALWAVANSANTFRVGIRYDGTNVEWSDYHTGNGVPQYLTCSRTPVSTDTEYTLVISGTGQAHAAVLMQNTTSAVNAYAIRDQGSQAYGETEINRAIRNIGGVPTLDIGMPQWRIMQLVTYVRRPFPEMTADTDTVDDQYGRAVEAGMLVYLLDSNKSNQDRTRLDRILVEERSRWTRFLTNNIDRPVPKPPLTVYVGGA